MLKILGKRPVTSAPVPNLALSLEERQVTKQPELTERYRVTPNIHSHNRQREPKRSKEAASSCGRAPEPIQDGIEKIPLVPVCFSKLPLYGGSRTDAEKED